MKKIAAFLFIVLVSMSLAAQAVFAVAEVPKSSVWFDPANAAAGEAIKLNALVYNNQTSNATVTVVFSDPAGTIGTTSTTITKATAKTVSVSWKMPVKNTVVTAKVSTAVTSAKKSLPGLVGVLGTVTVGSVAPEATALGSFPGSTQLAKWFGPLVSKIDAWRVGQKDTFVKLKASTLKKMGDVKLDINDKNILSKVLGNPVDYIVLAYATSGATLFASQALFYIAGFLLFLLILRAIVNRFI
ncbi:MAG: hypothetical protein JWL92_225 [Candidatus Nomurabacteria bacterium]|nr:hypothetical protein [Candidatus Nomurabacteria bacterium]